MSAPHGLSAGLSNDCGIEVVAHIWFNLAASLASGDVATPAVRNRDLLIRGLPRNSSSSRKTWFADARQTGSRAASEGSERATLSLSSCAGRSSTEIHSPREFCGRSTPRTGGRRRCLAAIGRRWRLAQFENRGHRRADPRDKIDASKRKGFLSAATPAGKEAVHRIARPSGPFLRAASTGQHVQRASGSSSP
jgi:hypothetical protein